MKRGTVPRSKMGVLLIVNNYPIRAVVMALFGTGEAIATIFFFSHYLYEKPRLTV